MEGSNTLGTGQGGKCTGRQARVLAKGGALLEKEQCTDVWHGMAVCQIDLRYCGVTYVWHMVGTSVRTSNVLSVGLVVSSDRNGCTRSSLRDSPLKKKPKYRPSSQKRVGRVGRGCQGDGFKCSATLQSIRAVIHALKTGLNTLTLARIFFYVTISVEDNIQY